MSQLDSAIMVRSLTESICAIAKSGLWKCYPDKDDKIPFSLVEDKKKVIKPTGKSIRYALISQIGISRWLRIQSDDRASLPDLWPRILARVNDIHHIGDFALLLWAAAESGRDDCDKCAKMVVQHWPAKQQICNAVELGWVVQSLVCLSERVELSADTHTVLKTARDKLFALYNPASRLFARHNRTGFTETLSRRVACFADQVYPILALANYGRRFHDSQSSDTAVAVAETICRLQGPMGQWWWHYDVQTGKVAEEYPVFSVHQHGMAPMALLAVDETANTDHIKYIEAGLMWLTGRNELNLKMMQPTQGVVWRDIHRREVGKMFRFVRGGLSLAGLDRTHQLTGKRWLGHVVNTECRPYELGWLLYAWAAELAETPNKSRI
jgi:hypothetical protein